MEQGRAFASHLPPYSLVLGAAVAAALLVVSREPLRDADLYWHVLAGQEMVEHRSVAMAADDWSLLAETGTWISTQWLSEILFAGLKASFGWAGLAGYTLATTAVALFLLARSTLHDRPAATTALPFLLATFSIALAAGARPQQFTLIGAAALGGVLDRGLAKRQLPRWFLLLPLVLLWANSHGGWILAPFVLTLLTVWGGVSDRAMTPFVRRAASLALLCLLAGAISPNGFRNVSAVFRFAASTRAIAEWQRVDLLSAGGAILLAMAVLAIGGWLGADRHMPTGVVLLAILAFSWTAWRNLPPRDAAPVTRRCKSVDCQLPSLRGTVGARLVGAGFGRSCRPGSGVCRARRQPQCLTFGQRRPCCACGARRWAGRKPPGVERLQHLGRSASLRGSFSEGCHRRAG